MNASLPIASLHWYSGELTPEYGIKVSNIRRVGYPFFSDAVSKEGTVMFAHGITPILNVSNILDSFAWFEKLGWEKAWDWGTPPAFGGVKSGRCEIFLCEGGQGERN